MKAQTAQALITEVKRGAALEEKLGTTMSRIYDALKTVIDDSIEEEVFRALNRENLVYQLEVEGNGKDCLEIVH